jgi:hypothetical protein
MTAPDIKGESGTPGKRGRQAGEELEKLQKALELKDEELSRYKNELVEALERISDLENRFVLFEKEDEAIEPEAADRAIELASPPELINLNVTPIDFNRPSVAIPHDQPFKVCLSLNLAGMKEAARGKFPCLISVFAKQLGSGNRMKVCETEKIVEAPENVQACLMGNALSVGTYRFEIQASASIPGSCNPYVARIEDGLINVY